MNKVKILSIDGGGIRGIIPAVILSAIEDGIRARKGEQARLADHVHLVAGTSTGGIIACGMLIPDEVDNLRPRYTMAEVLDIYMERGKDIFDRSALHKFLTVDGLFDEKYEATGLEKALLEKFGNTLLSELLRPCIVTAYDIQYRKTVFLGSHKTDEGRNTGRDFLVRHVARGTSAAPTYFEAANVPSIAGVHHALIDGGVFANNPAMCAYAEARGMTLADIEKPTAKDMFMLSIGTGSVKREYPYAEAKDYGKLKWVQPVIDIMMSGNSETVSYQLEKLFDAGGNPSGYIRIEPELHNAKSEMDDASPENLAALKEAGIKFVSDNPDVIKGIIETLLDETPPQP
ncbi:MAG: patatin-like phospholipase family protein [Flavobacteriales bacterium]|nr:patatin-like phospholipase family protein [Flavobacteriales bacterium]